MVDLERKELNADNFSGQGLSEADRGRLLVKLQSSNCSRVKQRPAGTAAFRVSRLPKTYSDKPVLWKAIGKYV